MANSATFLPAKASAVVIGAGPAAVMTVKLASGSLSPTLIAMSSPSLGSI
jgi:threonine dehydrogenase-like Zn-dependent dehydrogenase